MKIMMVIYDENNIYCEKLQLENPFHHLEGQLMHP